MPRYMAFFRQALVEDFPYHVSFDSKDDLSTSFLSHAKLCLSQLIKCSSSLWKYCLRILSWNRVPPYMHLQGSNLLTLSLLVSFQFMLRVPLDPWIWHCLSPLQLGRIPCIAPLLKAFKAGVDFRYDRLHFALEQFPQTFWSSTWYHSHA